MSAIVILGSIGVGAVLGWLTGILEPRQRPFHQILAVLAASAAVLFEVFWLAGWQASLAAICGGGLALLVHKLWRRELRKR